MVFVFNVFLLFSCRVSRLLSRTELRKKLHIGSTRSARLATKSLIQCFRDSSRRTKRNESTTKTRSGIGSSLKNILEKRGKKSKRKKVATIGECLRFFESVLLIWSFVCVFVL